MNRNASNGADQEKPKTESELLEQAKIDLKAQLESQSEDAKAKKIAESVKA